MKNIILLGGGGHCKSCIQILEELGNYEIAGILDLSEKVSTKILGYGIIGTDNDISKFNKKNFEFLITVGQTKSSSLRRKLFDHLSSVEATLPTVIAKSAIVSRHSTIGKGSIIMNHTLVNSDSSIGINCIINNFANIEHDVVIGDHCHVSTGAMVNGNVTVGNHVFIGSGAVITNGIILCDHAVIGAGSVVFKNIHKPGVYLGNPVNFIKEL